MIAKALVQDIFIFYTFQLLNVHDCLNTLIWKLIVKSYKIGLSFQQPFEADC